MQLDSFGDTATALVIGASGAIGGAFVRHLEAEGSFEHVIKASRSGVADIFLDLEDEASIERAARKVKADFPPLDLVIIATGRLHSHNGTPPEKALRQLDGAIMAEIFAANTIGPSLAIKYFAPLLARKKKALIACLSARVGSISDNGLGGWYSYRASKSALNMIVKCSAIELARTKPEAICVGLHPGTVDSALSKPFQAGVPTGKLFQPDYAAAQMLKVLDGLASSQSGSCFAYDASVVEP